MKKFNLFAVVILCAAFSFAQTAGQWSVGVGSDFTSLGGVYEKDGDKKGLGANVGYFAMDDVMISFSFNMNMPYEEATYILDEDNKPTDKVDYTETFEGDFDWAIGVRWYPFEKIFLEGHMNTGTGKNVDLYLASGVSLAIAFNDRLWIEPMIKFNIPGYEYGIESQRSLSLAWAFRYTF